MLPPQPLAPRRVDLVIEEDAVHEIARIATELNQNLQNIGPGDRPRRREGLPLDMVLTSR